MLDLVGVGLSIGGKPILHDLNLHVLPGEIHAILGMNGTGKSTLASLIMGLSGFSPTSGNVVFQGEDITALSISGRAKRGIRETGLRRPGNKGKPASVGADRSTSSALRT